MYHFGIYGLIFNLILYFISHRAIQCIMIQVIYIINKLYIHMDCFHSFIDYAQNNIFQCRLKCKLTTSANHLLSTDPLNVGMQDSPYTSSPKAETFDQTEPTVHTTRRIDHQEESKRGERDVACILTHAQLFVPNQICLIL